MCDKDDWSTSFLLSNILFVTAEVWWTSENFSVQLNTKMGLSSLDFLVCFTVVTLKLEKKSAVGDKCVHLPVKSVDVETFTSKIAL